MIAVSEVDATIWVAGIAAVGSVLTAILSVQSKHNQDTGNGHSIGASMARQEDRMEEHENRLDRIEVRLVEDLSEIKERLTSAVFDQERHMATYRHERRAVDE